MRFKGVLFDLDGTLLDTNDLIIKSFQHTIRTHFQQEVDVNIVRSYFGKPLRAALEYLGPGREEEMIHTYRAYNLQHHDELAKIFSGVVETIQALYNAGVALGIVTSKTRVTALRGLKLFDLDKYFAVVVGYEECKNHKPHPEPVQLALAQLGLAPGQCLMVGDSPFDLISAKSAGVKTAAVRWSELPFEKLQAENPDYILNSMADLLPICGINER